MVAQSGRVAPAVQLKQGQDKRLRAGHVWIYRSQIDAVIGNPAPGDIVDVYNPSRHFLGRGYYNPQSEIRVRLLTRLHEQIDDAFIAGRIGEALNLRERFLPGATSRRVLFSEGDRLPGVICDQYEDVLVVQFLTLGMEVRRNEVLAALQDQLHPVSIYERSDAGSRRLEGLDLQTGLISGRELPELVTVRENKLAFFADVTGGQKTGYFLDQKDNRRALQRLVPGARVLDAFCHTGSFAVHAAHYGAASVAGLDISADAVDLAQRNAAENGVAHTCKFAVGNAFDLLREYDHQKERFDVVILDPPAFAKGRDALEGARRGYKEVNLRALRILEPGGFLVTCSCSHHISPEIFWDVVMEAAADARRELRLVERRTQSLDHPILPAVKETEYLKCFIFQVL